MKHSHIINRNDIKTLSISELNQQAQHLLEQQFGLVWVCGEISNLSEPSSGHSYFSLKDNNAQVRCAFFKFQKAKLDCRLKNGITVMALAKVSLYTPRGDYQLIIQQLQLDGAGALHLKFEQLKKTLAKAGLFDPIHKKPLPTYPMTIGIISSATGAALQDIIKVLKRRCPFVRLIIYPSLVQGNNAAAMLCDAISTANDRSECAAIILARGGGSLEDLWPFNEASVVKAMAASTLPIITGIGHEIDTTLCDLTADLRAATPSAAAECISAGLEKIPVALQHIRQQLSKLMTYSLQQQRRQLTFLSKRLRHPSAQLSQQRQQLDFHAQRLQQRLEHYIQGHQQRLKQLKQSLEHLNPNNILHRGYAIISDSTQKTLSSVHELKLKQKITITLKDGSVPADVIR